MTIGSVISYPRGQWLNRLGHITLDTKCAGARFAGNPHVACEVEGAGNGDTVRTEAPALGESRRQQLLPLPKSTAPALDPTRRELGIVQRHLTPIGD